MSDTKGHILLASSSNDPDKLPNLLQQPSSRETFLEALSVSRMVVGRPYYLHSVKSWMLPLRKSVRNARGEPIALLSVGLRLDDAFVFWNNLSKPGTTLDIYIDRYGHRIYKSRRPPTKFPELYEKPFSPIDLKHLEKVVKKSTGHTLDEIRRMGSCVTFLHRFHNAEEMLTAWGYVPRYGLWVQYTLPMQKIDEEILKTWFSDLLLFLLMTFIVYLLFRRMINLEKKRADDLIKLALHDHLTGLPNRIYLQRHIGEWLYDQAPPFAVAFIDLDNFKNINDSLGHHYGDMILIEVATRLKSVLPPHGLIVRHGGDEFIMLLKSSDPKKLERLAQNIIEALSRPIQVESLVFNIGVSVGLSLYPRDGEDLFTLLSAADIAMYQAKKRKNSYAFFSEQMKKERNRNSRIEQELRGAIERREFHLVYQPQIDTAGRLHRVEALLRWHNATLGNVPPDQFIHVAEEIGLMPKIGHHLIDIAFEEIGHIQKETGISFSLSLNVSIRQFNEKEFLPRLTEQIDRSGFTISNVVLEITESLFIEELQRIVRQLQSVKSLGMRVSLDDFGTGYSSLSLLRRLPLDELKIDKSFIDTLQTDPASQAMVKAIITLCENLGFDIVAEGVEKRDQFEWLKKEGCDYFQGYWFAKPMDVKSLKAYILQTHRT